MWPELQHTKTTVVKWQFLYRKTSPAAQFLFALFPPRRPSGFSRLVPLALLLLLLRSGRLEGCGIQPGSAGFLVPFAPEGPLRCGPSGGALGAGGLATDSQRAGLGGNRRSGDCA